MSSGGALTLIVLSRLNQLLPQTQATLRMPAILELTQIFIAIYAIAEDIPHLFL